jgi:hypothetical protein
MIKKRKNLISYYNLTEDKKNKILNYIRKKEISIKKAAFHFRVTTSSIDKIFAERFGKREKQMTEILNNKN